MDKFIPYNKMSKKKQKEYNSTSRKNWGMVNPATKTHKEKNPKFFYKSDRNKDKAKLNKLDY